VSKVFGVSSLNMIGALLEKDTLSVDEIAEMAKGKLKRKVNQLVVFHHQLKFTSSRYNFNLTLYKS